MAVVVAILLAAFVLPWPWSAAVIVVALALEAMQLVAWSRYSRRGPPKTGPETLIGGLGTVATECRPLGRVWVDGESWRARCAEGADVGQHVRVLAVDGLALVVTPP